MVETSGYFEAFRHVLSALKTTQQNDVPFIDNIVHCERVVEPPQYLLTADEPEFDLRAIAGIRRPLSDAGANDDNDEDLFTDDQHLAFVPILNSDAGGHPLQHYISMLTVARSENRFDSANRHNSGSTGNRQDLPRSENSTGAARQQRIMDRKRRRGEREFADTRCLLYESRPRSVSGRDVQLPDEGHRASWRPQQEQEDGTVPVERATKEDA
jgi:hypothetical protein